MRKWLKIANFAVLYKDKKELEVFGFPSNCNLKRNLVNWKAAWLTPNGAWVFAVFSETRSCCRLDGFIVYCGIRALSFFRTQNNLKTNKQNEKKPTTIN